MNKTLPLSLLALVFGLAAGHLITQAVLNQSNTTTAQSTAPSAAVSVYSGETGGSDFISAPLSPSPTPDLSGNSYLLEVGAQVLHTLKDKDYTGLAALVHPQRGVTFTPYSTVDFNRDVHFSPDELIAASKGNQKYLWGTLDGKGDAIRMTFSEYCASFVFNADYTYAPVISIDQVMASGNSLENVGTAYPGCRYVEYYFPGVDPANSGFDWCALKLVFAQWNGTYKLVGIIHSQWTI